MTQGKLLKKNFEERGITLIALVITIVVLLILAVVAIQAVTSDGIIIKAKEAREASQLAEEIEKVNLAISEAKINPNYELTLESLSQTIEKYFGDDATVEGGTEVGYYLITVKGKNTYKIDLNGKILEQPGENAGGDTDGDDEGEEVLANTLVIEGYEDKDYMSMEAIDNKVICVKNKLTAERVVADEIVWTKSGTCASSLWIAARGSTLESEISTYDCYGQIELTFSHKDDSSLRGKITVYVGAPNEIIITNYPSIGVDQGSEIYLSACDTNNSPINFNQIEWISENTEIATVEGLSSGGRVTGVSAGTVKIIAKSRINPNIYGEITITVNGTATGPTSITITASGEKTTAKVGEEIVLYAQDEKGNYLYGDAVTWSGPSAASINAIGSGTIVTSTLAGSYQITVTSTVNPNVSDTIELNFTSAGPASITISGPTTATVGEEVILPVRDENGNMLYEADVTATANSAVSIRYASGNVIVASSVPGSSIPITVTSNSNPSVSKIHYISFIAAE